MEECSELIKELSKNIRGADNEAQIAEEIADVEITLDQMKILFNCDYDVETQKASKLLRLAQRVGDAKARAVMYER